MTLSEPPASLPQDPHPQPVPVSEASGESPAALSSGPVSPQFPDGSSGAAFRPNPGLEAKTGRGLAFGLVFIAIPVLVAIVVIALIIAANIYHYGS